NKAVEIDIAPRNTAVKTIKQTVYSVDRNHKLALLSHLLHKNNWGQTLVFSPKYRGQIYYKINKINTFILEKFLSLLVGEYVVYFI
ncbi:hypothetical protein MXD98_16480, partial [Legionella pneumophila]|nr:hypothetical protein [Legionella pneumophila]